MNGLLLFILISIVTAVAMVKKHRDTFEYSVVGVSDNRVFKSVSEKLKNKGGLVYFATGNQNAGTNQPATSGNQASTTPNPYVDYDKDYPYLGEFDGNWAKATGNKVSEIFGGKTIVLTEHAFKAIKEAFYNDIKQGTDIIIKCLRGYSGKGDLAPSGRMVPDVDKSCLLVDTDKNTSFVYIRTNQYGVKKMGFFPIEKNKASGADYAIATFHEIGTINPKDKRPYEFKINTNVGAWKVELYEKFKIKHGMSEETNKFGKKELNNSHRHGMYVPEFVTFIDDGTTYKVDWNSVICSNPLAAVITVDKERKDNYNSSKYIFIDKQNYMFANDMSADWGNVIFKGETIDGKTLHFMISSDNIKYYNSKDDAINNSGCASFYDFTNLENNLNIFRDIMETLGKIGGNIATYNYVSKEKIDRKFFAGILNKNETQKTLLYFLGLINRIDKQCLPSLGKEFDEILEIYRNYIYPMYGVRINKLGEALVEEIIKEYKAWRSSNATDPIGSLDSIKEQELSDVYNLYIYPRYGARINAGKKFFGVVSKEYVAWRGSNATDPIGSIYSLNEQKNADKFIEEYFEYIRLYEKEVSPINCVTE